MFKRRFQAFSGVAPPLGADWTCPPPAPCPPMSLTDMCTLSFSRFPPPAFLHLHLCQRQGWQRPLGWKVSGAASGGETTPALLSYLWFCFCTVTLIWWQRSDCLTNDFPCPAVLRTVWWELDRSAYELTAAQMWRLSVQMKHFYQPTKLFVPLVSWFTGTLFNCLHLHREMQFIFKSPVHYSKAWLQGGHCDDGHKA